MVKSSEKNDLVTKFTVFALWMAMGVFVVYPLVRVIRGFTFLG